MEEIEVSDIYNWNMWMKNRKELVSTSMRSYNTIVLCAARQTMFKIPIKIGIKRETERAILYRNIHKGASMMWHDIKDEIKNLEEDNGILAQHPNMEIRNEVCIKTRYSNFPRHKKINLMLERWVRDTLSYISDCLCIDNAGLYCLSLYYAFYDDLDISEDYKQEMVIEIERFRQKIKDRIYKLQVLIDGSMMVSKMTKNWR